MLLRRSPSPLRAAALGVRAAMPESGPTFDDLYHTHVEFLWRNALRLGVTDDAVDDVLQQVFLVVFRRLPEVMIRGAEKAWLLGVLLRVIRDHRRLLRRKSPHRFFETTDPESLVDEGRQPDESLARVEAATLIQRWLGALTDAKREVFVLAELEELTAREIADAIGTNPRTVYSRLRAAREEVEAAAGRYRRLEDGSPRCA